ncbi:50S ribosomal protein L15 [Thermosipho sp. 1063]|uniref:50S ribosomal protein L15 n=1 Tax=unclassified Thermosipho (in: thermotogales) TaxID=2676525 RepID=UPI00094924F2|nr:MULTISPECIES: 50S ribosomal protein L15 [unclassified Thermosipho (in: thermotogales)]ANQ53898.1 50S ribosomal protein L15 [Thermosipho sp. 1070]APT72345.1 50S ribosomal protein L15 [Thermosipho sp. 1063]OOC43589.1 50S ribosomal protein L15 [Thermosipho sp. 1074]
MRLSDIKPTPGSMKKRTRVGRGIGSGKGKTSGKGHKGQKARGRGKVHIWFEGGQTPLHRRLPKFGFKNFAKKVYTVINVEQLEKYFESGEEVTPDKLMERGLIKKINDGVKILGNGEITKPLTVIAHAFSSSARRKIEAVGGKAEVI